MHLEKDGLPPYSAAPITDQRRRRPLFRRKRTIKLITLACLAFIALAQWKQLRAPGPSAPSTRLSVQRLQDNLSTCTKIHRKPQDPAGPGREKNARYIDGHKPTLIRNATVWTGEPTKSSSGKESYSWIQADVLLEYGLIKKVEPEISLTSLPSDCEVWDAKGRQLTAGLLDMHSHAGVFSLPVLNGRLDVNELASPITPYVRSIDGLHPLDHQIQVIKSGGVTTSLVLPGSGNSIGGEAYAIKHAVGKKDGRPEISVADMLADPDRNWRYMKMACGENPKNVYGRAIGGSPFTRMGESWEMRHAFEQAATLVRKQDDWCNMAETVGVENVGDYLPEELKWESLGAVLRGQVLVNTHCYTIPDLESFVDHTNEFNFSVRAFHHAHETYLVPEILKRAYGNVPPASALFADNMFYKTEAYLGTPFAGKILLENGLVPIYVSDNPVLNAQHLVLEAAKAYRYGLPYHAALAAVTSAPAFYMGFGNRLGKIKPGFDADVVVWDSDPLQLGAAPVQVWIDGTAQFDDPVELDKPVSEPMVPDPKFGKIPDEPVQMKDVIFTGISHVYYKDNERIASDEPLVVVITNGKINCIGTCSADLQSASAKGSPSVIHLQNGHLTHAFTAFGGQLGLMEIDQELSTSNGPDGGYNVFSRGVDGLALDTKKLLVAHRYGVSRAISAPKFSAAGISRLGTSAGFRTAAKTVLDDGAVWLDDVAVHYSLEFSEAKNPATPSMSAAVGALRAKLVAAATSNATIADSLSEAAFLQKVVNGTMALVIHVQSADFIAASLKIKHDVDKIAPSPLRLVIHGGAESHILAKELASASVGVILSPFLSYKQMWDERRALTGAPLTNGTAVDALFDAGVKVGIGIDEDWRVREMGIDAAIVHRNGGGRISKKEALAMVSVNLYEMLGVKMEGDFLVFEGSPVDVSGRVRGVGSGGIVDVIV